MAGLYSPNKNVLLHNVRRRRWIRIRKTEGLLKQAKKLDRKESKRIGSKSKSKSKRPKQDKKVTKNGSETEQNKKEKATKTALNAPVTSVTTIKVDIDEDDINFDDGWDDSNSENENESELTPNSDDLQQKTPLSPTGIKIQTKNGV